MTQPAASKDVLLIALREQNSSGQSGWAALTARGPDTEVVLSLAKGTMESRAVHIHTGACGPTLGGVVHPLTGFADGSSTTLLAGVSLDSVRTGAFAINAHNAQTSSIYTACGNIPTTADSLTIALSEQNSSGQSGWATLTTRGPDTEVVLSLAKGTMESKAVHIHTGACGPTLGGVVHPLTSFADGRSVTLLAGVSLDSVRTGGFAVNAHNAQTSSIYTACGVIPAKTASTAPASALSVNLANFKFDPAVLTVEAGKKARFTVIGDSRSHTFTVAQLGVDVTVAPNATQTIEFDVPAGSSGEMALVCTIHQASRSMVGKLQVAPAGMGSY